MMATIDEVLARIRSFGSEPRIVVHRRGPSPFPLSCELGKPVAWSVDKVEAACSVSLPSDLKEFWDRVGSARLFEDVEYGQWGLMIWSAEEATERSSKIARERSKDYRPGDLFVGEFLGDSDLLLIRGDRSAPDYGQAMIALPIDARAEWDTVGSSFTDFLDRFVRASGDKFWESERASQSRA
jgi:SMI1 / KNR4 family (SUKH-1)